MPAFILRLRPAIESLLRSQVGHKQPLFGSPGMDLPLTNMYNIFKDDVWKALVLELGPLDPNWFEVLTSQASVIDGSLSDQEDLCANQEGNSKGSLEKPAVESQFFSTPKVFRHSRVVSPQTEDEQSFTLAQEKGALPWIKTQSPCLFQLTIQGEKCDVFQPQGDDSFDLLATPNQSTISYAKHISESLGAQMNPDISWTSSLNTPPAVPSTLILPIPDNKPCSTNVPADGNVVFVRKLFPSLSKTSANEASKSCDPVAFQGPISPKVPDGPQTFSNHEECVWQQKVPDTIEDEEVRSSVVDVLDGAEDALSIFFANSSSALRKVKPERNKRKQILQAKENVCSSKDDLSTSKATSDEERDGCTLSSYTKTGHTGMSQWSPLSLSDIPSCSAGGIIVPEQLHNSSRLSGPSKDIQNVEFQSKTRLFDTVGIAELDPMRVDSSIEIPYSEELCIEQLGSSDCSNAEKTEGHKQGQPLGENLVGTVKAKIQDIDMSQLCRDFAQDFSQMPDSGRTASRDHFSPSACLLAMKKAKQKAEVNPQHHPNKSISNPKFPTSGVPVNDSGFHSAVANSTNITGSSFLENTGLSRTSTDFKSDLQTETDIPSTKAFPKTMHFNPEAEMELISAHTSKEEKDLEPVMSTDITVQKPSSAQGADDIPSIPLNDQKQTKETSTSPLVVHSLGFKTASNKGIRISSASLEKAKLIFKETESETAFYNLPTTSGYDTMNKSTSKEAGNTSTFSSKPSQTSITETFGGITPQLTASQTDDVTELCSLLEKTDSQFELTPVKILKTKQQNDATSPQKADRELDPDLLAGIDFDDSFSSDSLQCARNENATYSSKHSSEDEASDDPRKTVRASSPQNVSSVAFKTAGGKVLRVSDKCLSKAKSLFADLEEFPTNRKSSGNKRVEIGSNTKQKSSMDGCKKNLKFAINEDSCSIRAGNCFEELASFKKPTKSISGDDTKSSESKKNDPNMCQTGFFMANGKNICVQAKNMHHAKDIFKDCDVTDNKSEFIKHLPENVKRREHLSKYDNFDIPKRRIDGCSVTENADLLPCDTIEPHQGILKVETNVAPFHRNSFSASKPDLSMLCSASKTIDSNESCSAAGKKAFVSADETKNSEYLLKETHSPEDGKGQLQEDWSSSNHTDQPRICGFQTAAGKELIVSSAALKKAQTMFSENEGVKERNRVIPPHSRIPSIESENDKSHALQKAKVCSNISLNAVNPCGNKLKEGPNNVEKMCSGFTTTNKANEFEENLLKSNHSLKDFDLVSDKEMQESDVFLENHVDAENTVLPKDQECQLPVYEKIKSNPDQKPTISFSQPGCPEDPPSFQNAGFQMANGKAVTFSAEALRKTKSVFNECEAPEDKTLPTLLQTKASVLHIRGGFCSASGMPISASSEALHRAESMFSDISFSGNKPDVCQTTQKVVEKGKINVGFQTAGGAKVHVSKTNLLKAKYLLRDFGDLVSDKEMQEAHVFLENDVNAENAALTKDQECNLPFMEGDNEEGRSNPNQRTTLNFPVPEDGSSENTNVFQNDQISFQNVGFQTANGKAVTFSSEALRKAKSMFNGCEAPEDKTLPTPLQSKASVLPFRGTTEQNQDNKERIHFGFQTAGGTKVHVSKTNLLKTKHLFKDLDDLVSDKEMQEADVFLKNVDVNAENAALTKATCNFSEPGNGSSENINKEILQNKDPSSFQNVGFQTANGKAVTFSAEALRKAKSVFNECEAPEDNTLQSKATVLQDLVDNKERIHFGFQTAGGAKVHVSKTNLLKAKHLFKDFDDLVSDKEMQEADVLLKNVDVNAENGVLTKDWECKNPLKEGGNEEVRSNPNQRTTLNFSEPEDGSSENTKILQNDLLSFQNVGFQTANGKAVTFSSEALRKAKSMFNGCEALEDKTLPTPLQSNANVLPFRGTTEQNQDIKERIHFGFQTAGGTKVHVSKTNLLKAKHLFKDLDDSVSKATEGTDPSSETSSVLSKATGLKDNISKHDQIIAVNAPANGWTESRNVGFQTASGSTVVVSDEALKRAKTLLGEGEEVANVSSPLCKIPVSGSSGFFAASGKAVTFSSEALQKAKSLFSDIRADVSDFTDTKRVEQKQEDAQLWGFTAAGRTKTDTKVADKCHSNIKKLDLNNAKDVSSDVDLTNLAPSETVVQSENYKLETSQVMDYKRPENTKAEESSALMFPSLNLTGCTETQHRLLAQEALDCTKALLEDEDLAGQSFCPAAQTALRLDYPQATTGSDAEEKRQRKRLMGDPDPTGQPPLKRQLLEEFNQTNDGSNDSGLQPVKSCPLGLMKDRGVFKYSTSLYPNITKPHSNGKTKTTTTVQHSTPDNSRSAGSKMSPFIPPFYKNANSETSKTSVPQLTTRTPVFAPPFKKQRTVLQGKTDQNTNKLSPVTESNSSAYVPSSKNAQEPSNVISTVNTHSNDTKNPNVDVNGGSVRFMSHPDQAFSKDEHQVFLNSELARDMQDMRIRKKKRQNIRPLQGSLFLTKTSGVAKIPLKAAVNGKLPTRCPPEQLYRRGVHAHVSGITSETAESFRFRLLHFFKRDTFIDEGGVKLADGGWLIPTKDGTAGKEEFFRALCDTPGVDPKLITEAWGYNHYRWIVWKQASMEKSFPEAMGGICLTPEQVLLQLKYRYDVEVDHSRRPALRKITEKDDTAAKTLVLCVCGIVSKGARASSSRTPESSDPASAVVWLTDGWYALKAQLDQPLTAMLNKGLLPVGGKLIIHGAQLVGSQDACPPLEAPESLMLKICANSTRRARWDTKLGFHKDPRPFLLPIASLFSRGGPVGCADVVVLRSYPIQWMERKADGGVVFRTTRAEEREARRFSEVKHKAMEVLFAKVQTEFENEEKEKTKSQRRKQNLDVANLQDGEELHAAVGDDPAYLEAHLSEQQLQTLQAYKRSLMERKQAELQDRYRRALEEEDQEIKCPKRDVTPVWRLSVADSLGPPSCVYQLSLWRPSSDVESLLKEGGRFKVYNLAAAEGKKRSSHESVQLTGTKKTQFQVLQTSQEWMSERFQPRVSTDFESLQNPDFRPLCGEVDLSGYVVSVIDGHGSSPAFYLADGKLNLVKIRCFSSLSQTGLEDVVKPRVLLALSNLQLRGQSMFPTPVVYAGDLTVFSTNPKEAHLQESLSHLKNRIQRDENFHGNAEEKLSHLIKSGGLGLVSPMAVKLQTLPSSSDKKDESKITFQKPASFTPVSKNPQAETPLSKKDPKILKRRRALDYLSRIPSPPPLSVLGSVSSPCVKKTFNPPRRSGPPSQFKTEKIQTVKPSVVEDEWVNDEELVMIDTQALGIK